jgi:late competence protein required for DNA uptake (superfamily II DNA/RNA helicase)
MKTYKIVMEIAIKEGDTEFIYQSIEQQLERGEDILKFDVEEITE